MEPELSLEDELILVLRDELFGGSWERMEEDLAARAQWCHPSDEVERQVACDLRRIGRMREIEATGFDLGALRVLGREEPNLVGAGRGNRF